MSEADIRLALHAAEGALREAREAERWAMSVAVHDRTEAARRVGQAAHRTVIHLEDAIRTLRRALDEGWKAREVDSGCAWATP